MGKFEVSKLRKNRDRRRIQQDILHVTFTSSQLCEKATQFKRYDIKSQGTNRGFVRNAMSTVLKTCEINKWLVGNLLCSF
jgi:hypothetical protein